MVRSPRATSPTPPAAGVKIQRSQVELDKPIKTLGAHKIEIHLHPEVSVEITALVARSADEAEFLSKGGKLVAETERAAMEAAEAAQRTAAQAAALFEPVSRPRPPPKAICRGPGRAEEAPADKQSRVLRALSGACHRTRWHAFSLSVLSSGPIRARLARGPEELELPRDLEDRRGRHGGLVALPLLGLASSLFTVRRAVAASRRDAAGRHLRQHAVLLMVVGLGTTVIGTGTAWLVTMYRFPRSRLRNGR